MGNLSRRQLEVKAEAAERRLERDASRQWPLTAREQRAYVDKSEQNYRLNESMRSARLVNFDSIPEWRTPVALRVSSSQEEAVRLSEVIDTLERMTGTEQAAWFLDAIEGTVSESRDRQTIYRIRKRLREEIGDDGD